MIRKVLGATLVLAALVAQPSQARWADWPTVPDAELEQIVRVAYTAAANYARKNVNYFARDGITDPLRSAIEDELGRQNLMLVNVATAPAADLAGTRVCAAEGVELRFAVNLFGDGISLAAATAKRVFSYHYEPREEAAIVVAPSQACTKE